MRVRNAEGKQRTLGTYETEAEAEAVRGDADKIIARRAQASTTSGPLTLAAWGKTWYAAREKEGYSPGRWWIDVLHVEGETGDPDEDPAPDGTPATMLTIAEADTLGEALDLVRGRAPWWRAEAQAQLEREQTDRQGAGEGPPQDAEG